MACQGVAQSSTEAAPATAHGVEAGPRRWPDRAEPQTERRRLVARVPEDAVPGETKLRIRVGPEESLVARVPASACPGADGLAFMRDGSGSWCAELVPGQVLQASSLVADPSPGKICTSVTLTHVALDPDQGFQELREAAVAAGAVVSPKIRRSSVEGLGIAGMVAHEPIEEGELLLSIPSSLHLTPSRLSRAMPELHAAVCSLPGLCDRLRVEVTHAACLAAMLGEAICRAEALASGGAEEPPPASAAARVWARYCDALLGEDFSDHPYWRCLDDAEQARALLAPSREYEHAGAMVRELVRAYWAIARGVAAELLGTRFDAGLLIQARLCVLSRVFRTSERYAAVPLVDLFNHSEQPGAAWLWDAGRDAMVVTACRAHAPQEQICISYGAHSNPLLFRTYGFTLPPGAEPSWTFVLQGTKPRALYEKYLPARHAELNIHLDSAQFQDSLVEALNACAEVGQDPREFLLELCRQCQRPYEDDPLLRPALAALARRRGSDPSSGAWWEEAVPARAARWEEPCRRVKMSEYLCLVAHAEAAEVALGRPPAGGGCLAAAATVRSLLADAFEELRQHGRFGIDVRPAC
ncbi:unnamed protein product [Prorocentrum cordatum]|uniref:SET domain-containing protein n=1 Tax=Prorocentrum cordatum TaxID=2364126 RepID=A0ABN9XQN5_9DINO|nr:unnamed protein product [Polarella glacialis]